jgi:hypothetical protein
LAKTTGGKMKNLILIVSILILAACGEKEEYTDFIRNGLPEDAIITGLKFEIDFPGKPINALDPNSDIVYTICDNGILVTGTESCK